MMRLWKTQFNHLGTSEYCQKGHRTNSKNAAIQQQTKSLGATGASSNKSPAITQFLIVSALIALCSSATPLVAFAVPSFHASILDQSKKAPYANFLRIAQNEAPAAQNEPPRETTAIDVPRAETREQTNKPTTSQASDDEVSLDETINKAVQEAVDKKINAVLKKLDLLFAFQELQILAAELESREIVTDMARDSILRHLSKMKNFKDYENIPGFVSTLKRIIDSLTSSYQVSAVDEIDDLFRADINRIPDVPRWMTNHFGRVLVTSTDLKNRSSKRWERLQHYSDVTKQNRNPEISLLWEILTQFTLSNETKSSDVTSLISMLEHFNERDRQSFFEALEQESNTSPSEPPDLRRLAQIATKLINLYQTEFAQFGYQPNG